MFNWYRVRKCCYKVISTAALCCFMISNVSADWLHIPGQLTVEILQTPTPMVALKKYYLVYELHLTNYQHAPVTLASLEIFTSEASDNHVPAFKFESKDLEKLMHPIGNSDNANQDQNNLRVIQAGNSTIVFLWLPFNSEKSLPKQLIHKITFNTSHKNETVTLVTLTDPMIITKTPPMIVSPPLGGDDWVAGAGPSNTSYHRAANLVVNGHDYFAQRYAIDFIKLGSDGIAFKGDGSKNENYYCYGKDIFAVSSGTVVDIKDEIPENIPQSGKTALPMDMDTVGGNYVVIDMGNNHYAFYAHMIPKSLKVKRGDRVIRGQILGRVGNSGNSTEPHLHFHMVDKPSFLGGNGLPYAFDKFFIRPSKLLNNDPFQVQFLNDSLQPATNELVLENTVITF